MNLFDIMALLTSVAAAFSYINYRYIRLPTTIGLMLISLTLSLLLILFGQFLFPVGETQVRRLLAFIDFNQALMQGMLGFLLFAGALHININDLMEDKWVIGVFATVGVVISTVVVGVAMYVLSHWLGFPLSLIHCLLFGALISPTDPIAVLATLKEIDASRRLSARIAGESLFNDGIGVVVFIEVLLIATGGRAASFLSISVLFLKEAAGGILFGVLLGGLGYRLLKSVDNYQVEVLITLAIVMGGYALAQPLQISGPLAIVAAGLLVGNYGRRFAMSDKTRANLDTFWELIDEIMNAVLFLLIGLEVLAISFSRTVVLAGLVAIPVVLFARYLSIGIPVSLFRLLGRYGPYGIKVMTWGGLRGGIPVALALSLPPETQRDIILTMTYAVVVFSILVQGMTIKYLVGPPRAD